MAGTREHPPGGLPRNNRPGLTAEYSTRARAEHCCTQALPGPCALALQHTKPCRQGGPVLRRVAALAQAPAEAPARALPAGLKSLPSAAGRLLCDARTASMYRWGWGGARKAKVGPTGAPVV